MSRLFKSSSELLGKANRFNPDEEDYDDEDGEEWTYEYMTDSEDEWDELNGEDGGDVSANLLLDLGRTKENKMEEEKKIEKKAESNKKRETKEKDDEKEEMAKKRVKEEEKLEKRMDLKNLNEKEEESKFEKSKKVEDLEFKNKTIEMRKDKEKKKLDEERQEGKRKSLVANLDDTKSANNKKQQPPDPPLKQKIIIEEKKEKAAEKSKKNTPSPAALKQVDGSKGKERNTPLESGHKNEEERDGETNNSAAKSSTLEQRERESSSPVKNKEMEKTSSKPKEKAKKRIVSPGKNVEDETLRKGEVSRSTISTEKNTTNQLTNEKKKTTKAPQSPPRSALPAKDLEKKKEGQPKIDEKESLKVTKSSVPVEEKRQTESILKKRYSVSPAKKVGFEGAREEGMAGKTMTTMTRRRERESASPVKKIDYADERKSRLDESKRRVTVEQLAKKEKNEQPEANRASSVLLDDNEKGTKGKGEKQDKDKPRPDTTAPKIKEPIPRSHSSIVESNVRKYLSNVAASTAADGQKGSFMKAKSTTPANRTRSVSPMKSVLERRKAFINTEAPPLIIDNVPRGNLLARIMKNPPKQPSPPPPKQFKWQLPTTSKATESTYRRPPPKPQPYMSSAPEHREKPLIIEPILYPPEEQKKYDEEKQDEEKGERGKAERVPVAHNEKTKSKGNIAQKKPIEEETRKKIPATPKASSIKKEEKEIKKKDTTRKREELVGKEKKMKKKSAGNESAAAEEIKMKKVGESPLQKKATEKEEVKKKKEENEKGQEKEEDGETDVEMEEEERAEMEEAEMEDEEVIEEEDKENIDDNENEEEGGRKRKRRSGNKRKDRKRKREKQEKTPRKWVPPPRPPPEIIEMPPEERHLWEIGREEVRQGVRPTKLYARKERTDSIELPYVLPWENVPSLESQAGMAAFGKQRHGPDTHIDEGHNPLVQGALKPETLLPLFEENERQCASQKGLTSFGAHRRNVEKVVDSHEYESDDKLHLSQSVIPRQMVGSVQPNTGDVEPMWGHLRLQTPKAPMKCAPDSSGFIRRQFQPVNPENRAGTNIMDRRRNVVQMVHVEKGVMEELKPRQDSQGIVPRIFATDDISMRTGADFGAFRPLIARSEGGYRMSFDDEVLCRLATPFQTAPSLNYGPSRRNS